MKPLTVRMKSADVMEVCLYGQIGQSYWSGGVSAKDFRAQIKALKGKTINLRINSPGGSVIEGAAMLVALDEHDGRLEIDVDGLAASAASVLLMAGDVVRVASNALVMIHNPMDSVDGTAADLRARADLLDKVREQILDAYMRKAKDSREAVGAYMDAETWWTGAEAVEAGFADSCTSPVKMAACAGRHLRALAKLACKHVPATLKAEAAPEFAVGDSVSWLDPDPDGLCATEEDGVVEEVGTGEVGIPGTDLTLKGSTEDPAVRVRDEDEEDTTYYLVRASQLTLAAPMTAQAAPPSGPVPAAVPDALAETRRRQEIAARL